MRISVQIVKRVLRTSLGRLLWSSVPSILHLFLQASNFEFYECIYDKIIIGVNMLHLFKLISTIDNDDTLTIYIENDDYIEFLCPPNHYSNHKIDVNKKYCFILKRNHYYEPILFYKNVVNEIDEDTQYLKVLSESLIEKQELHLSLIHI